MQILIGIILVVVVLGSIFYFDVWPKCKEDYLYKIDFFKNYKKCGLPVITLTCNRKRYNFLIDTGSSCNLLNIEDFKDVKNKTKSKFGLLVAGGEVDTGGSFDTSLLLRHKLSKFTVDFSAVDLSAAFNQIKNKDGVKLHGILGNKFFAKYRWSVDFNQMVVWMK